jgi:hypothetical protein
VFPGLGTDGFVTSPSANGIFPYHIGTNVEGGSFDHCPWVETLTSIFSGEIGAYPHI